ncbi:hypothetical protein [Rothia nasimurium]|uniref:hypothetical protein n=1 Tax=Rothia nasimurium TaxID=85336 RepID=UPI001F2271FA|nr:hypothetical protein [Rothia nasimurium]
MMARNSKTKGSGQTRKQKIFSSLAFLVSIFIFVGIPLGEKYRQANAVDQQCTIVSAEVSSSRSGTGGLSTSSTKLKIRTEECGTVYVSKVLSPSHAGSWDEMAAELDGYRGQQVVLVFPPFQLPAEGDYALGYGYRL